MLVKAEEKQISFWFQEMDSFFEIGCRILEQEKLEQMLPYKRELQDGMEKLTFQARDEKIARLIDIIPTFTEGDLVDVLYEMIYLNKKVEENGFLQKECIWYKYDNIYYDRENNRIMAAILPITRELRYADGSRWYDWFEDTMERVISYLPKRKADYAGKIVFMLRAGELDMEGALTEIDKLGCSLSTELIKTLKHDENVTLRLLYSGKFGRVEFIVGDDDFLIGRNADVSDGVIDTQLSKAVSRKHCLITKVNNKYFVQDLKSVNHTLVNGIMIPPYELMELENNDILSVADIEFRVTISD